MLCPMKHLECECKKAKCAWWRVDGNDGACAVLEIAINSADLGTVVDAVYELKEAIREINRD